MAVAPRKVPEHIREIFDKYVDNHFRRLKKETACEMFMKEFDLSMDHAKVMFDIFDKDRNDELSIWEFQQFYNLIGENCNQIVGMYNNVADSSGNVDISATFEAMRVLKTPSGRNLTEEEIAMLLKNAAGPEKAIDMPKFINMICRLKLFRE